MEDPSRLIERLKALVLALNDRGQSGAAIVRAMAAEASEDPARLSRDDFLGLMSGTLRWSSEHASTYFYEHYRSAVGASDASEVPACGAPDESCGAVVAPYPVDSVRSSLRASSDAAVDWYLTRSAPVSRERFLSHAGIADAGRGAVYSYHAAGEDSDTAIYVGITGYRVKSRLYTPTSPHARSVWWEDWSYMRFVPVEVAGDRQVLELLLIVGLGPRVNRKPSAIDVDTFLHD